MNIFKKPSIKRKIKLLSASLLFSSFSYAQNTTPDESFSLGKVRYFIIEEKGNAHSKNDTVFYKLYRAGKNKIIAKEIKSVINKISKDTLKSGYYELSKNRISFYITGKEQPVVQHLYTQNEKGLLVLKTNYLDRMVSSVPAVVEMTPQSAPSLAEEREILGQVDVQAEFPGGMDKLYRFIGSYVRYPEEAKKNGIQGTVRVKFIIEKDGSIGDIEVLNKLGHGFDDEVIRVLRRMPKWKPAELHGRPVRSFFLLPVAFKQN